MMAKFREVTVRIWTAKRTKADDPAIRDASDWREADDVLIESNGS